MRTYTADSLTEADVLELRAALLAKSDGQFTDDTDACGMAFSTHPNADFAAWQRSVGRSRCAELLNGLEKDKEIKRLRDDALQKIVDASDGNQKIKSDSTFRAWAAAYAEMVLEGKETK